MLKIATAREMQQIDSLTIEKYGIAGTVLMERAGLSVVGKINEISTHKKVLVLCGGGNNGGDGFVIARELHNQGREVEVYFCAETVGLKGDAKVNFEAAKKFDVKIYSVKKFLSHIPSCDTGQCIIVDALLGTGLSKAVREPLSDVIEKVNKMSCPVVSVDIPSGICSDTGRVMGSAIKAGYTVTFGLPKRGLLLHPGAADTGKLSIKDIGFPRRLLDSKKIRVHAVRKADAMSLLPSRPEYSHKGTYGHVLLVAGSKGKTGAALMAAKACLRTGAGLVTIGIPETLVNAFHGRVTEEMILPLPDRGDGTLSYQAVDPIMEFMKTKANVFAIGPGLSVDEEISRLVLLLIAGSKIPVVIDADGINAIADNISIFKKCSAPIILTPHPGEMARLLGSGRGARRVDKAGISALRNSIDRDRINTALSFAEKTGTYVVLKGVPTVTAVPDGDAFINSSGNPGMATAGAGDVLTGMISAFLAQKSAPADAALIGVYFHGKAGDLVSEKKGRRSLIASDIIKAIPMVLRSH